jgi:hypothetical protein
MSGLTSHDVRKLHVCSECGKLGAYGSELATKIDAPLVVRTGLRSYAHPKCLRIEHLVLLSEKELGEVRLGDVSNRTMETLLLTFANRAQGGRG